MNTSRSCARGFTLVELLIVMLVGGILALVAVPSLREALNNTRHTSATSLLQGDLNAARAEAIKRNARVLVCGRNGAGDNCAGVTNWSVGWVVCIEDGAAANTCGATTSTVPNPIFVRPPVDSSLTVTASANTIRFNANSTQGAGGAQTVAVAGTWAGAPTRTLTVAATGNVSK